MNVDKKKRFQFSERSERAKYIGGVYKNFLKGKVADIGSYQSDLKKYIDGEYIGMDILDSPEVDITIDLEKQKIPLDDNSINCIVCTDVLEHLNNFHDVFEELIRVSSDYLIISIPNCFNYEVIFRILAAKKIKFYGLPEDKPEDRHKWFLSHNENISFFENNQKKYNYTIIDAHAHPLRYRGIKGYIILFFVFLMSFGNFKQLSTMSTWVLLKKNK